MRLQISLIIPTSQEQDFLTAKSSECTGQINTLLELFFFLMKYYHLHFLSIIFLAFVGCQKEAIEAPANYKKILHISHIRSNIQGEVNPKLNEINFESYDVLCLGGDIDLHTSKDENTMKIWNDLFHFSRENTLWSLGNHDITDRTLIKKFTNRLSYYTWSYKTLTFLILDDQIDNSNIIGEQLALLEQVTDTITNTSHLIVLTHRLLWMPENIDLEPLIDSIPNGGNCNTNSCTKTNNFYQDVYPKLLKIKNRGIEVICIAGDLGLKTNEFEYLTNEGIHFLASGINVHANDNKVLLMEYEPKNKTLNWYFEDLENL